ncbi:hypothetical protein HGRIS_010112 [Hohenbuehelia grisea]|uniref:non-specific serine/threonine protein kinase n=1 Tax=Hohenbuehelia grisea TaxID=104357 RepID=A0ABR3J3S4_9AGAR
MEAIPSSSLSALLQHPPQQDNYADVCSSFVKEVLHDWNSQTSEPTPFSNHWIKVIDVLLTHYVPNFPAFEEVQWSEASERIKYIVEMLEFIERAAVHVEGVYAASDPFAYRVFSSLFNLCHTLDTWVTDDTPGELPAPTPQVLQQKARAALHAVIKSLVHFPRTCENRSVVEPRSFIRLLSECVKLSADLTDEHQLLVFPARIALKSCPRSEEVTDDPPLAVVIRKAVHLPLALSLSLEVVAQAISMHHQLTYPPLGDIHRRTVELVRLAFDLCLSPNCPSTVPLRTKTLVSLVLSATCLPYTSTDPQDQSCSLLDSLQLRILLYRLQLGPRPELQPMDSMLQTVFRKPPHNGVAKDDLLHILEVLRTTASCEDSASLHALANTMIVASLPTMSIEALNEIQAHVNGMESTPEQQRLIHSIEGRMSLKATSHGQSAVPWRSRLRQALTDLTGEEVVFMEDDNEVNHSRRALDEVRVRLDSALSEHVNRTEMCQRISTFICAVAQCEGTANHRKVPLELVPTLHPMLQRLLESPEEEVNNAVRRGVYEVYRIVFRHQGDSIAASSHREAFEVLLRGICDKDRGTRLSAGRAFVEFMLLSAMIDPNSTEPILARLFRTLEDARHHIWETTLVTTGSLGKLASSDMLGQVVYSLISHLGRQNPVLRGLAYIQLLEIAKHHQKAPYSLLLPYMSQIAPFLVSRIRSQPNLLTETCRLISMNTTDFISTTLPRTLPRIFTNCETKVLEAIAKDLETKPSTLFIEHSHEIFAHIFLLPSELATNNALDFVLAILTSATGTNEILISSVVNSCIIPLLSELVVALGDPLQNQAAKDAIAKVEKCLSAAPPSKTRKKPLVNDGLLKSYIFGIIATINEMLQDVQGKKSAESKRQIVRSLKELVMMIGPAIGNVAPQIVATFQSLLPVTELADVTLQSWYTFLSTLTLEDLALQIGLTSAALSSMWTSFTPPAKSIASKILRFIIVTNGNALKPHLGEIGDLTHPEWEEINATLCTIRGKVMPSEQLHRILGRTSSENVAVVIQSLEELKRFMGDEHPKFVRELASGAAFDPLIGQILSALFTAARRDGDGTESLRLLAYECIGILGAVDPDRCDIRFNDSQVVMMSNFEDEAESQAFATHLVTELLIGIFRATSDIKYQNQLAYSIQELLRFCKFTAALIGGTEERKSVSLRTRQNWDALPKHVLETIAPMLEARFSLNQNPSPSASYPIYPHQSTYREWIQVFTSDLIEKASGTNARAIFGVFRSVIRHKDVSVAHFVLPHLVLNILISGADAHAQCIRSEILVVLEDQIKPESSSSPDKRLLSAEAVFMLLDHLSKWARAVRQKLTGHSGSTSKRAPPRSKVEEGQLLKIDSVLSSIDESLMAKAALRCKSYARALMNFERQVMTLRERNARSPDLPMHYEKLHEIYAHLDQPDGMEGVSTLILSPSLEHQIRQHESMGQWTSAQSGWEVRLQKEPDNLDFHLGLLRCLRNLGHYDTLRTHVKGVLARNPDWNRALAGFQVESAWMVGAWSEVEELSQIEDTQTPSMVIARLLLSMRTGDFDAVTSSLRVARSALGSPITASGAKSYRHCYDAVLNLHLTHELELISNAVLDFPVGSQANAPATRQRMLTDLSAILDSRLDATLPTFRVREPVLGMRRTALALRVASHNKVIVTEIGKSWVASAKNARKAGQWQTAYSAILQARQSHLKYSFMESAKLLKATGEPLRALQELEHSMRQLGLIDTAADIDLTGEDDPATKLLKGKSHVLRARWMNESDRFDTALILKIFSDGADHSPRWEGGNYHLGQFHDNSYKELPPAEQASRGIRMHVYTVRFFIKSLKSGSKHVFETVPRLLTIWLDVGADERQSKTESFKKINDSVSRAIKEIPAYKWYAAFPQIVSRLMHDNTDVAKSLANLMLNVMHEYPLQALWQFVSAANNRKDSARGARAMHILSQLKSNPAAAKTKVPILVNETLSMTQELLNLCESHVQDSRTVLIMSMSRDFPKLYRKGRSQLLIPLQESLSVTLPPNSSQESLHQPFPPDAPTFEEFGESIEVMTSMARPKKISIRGSDGQIYMFLGKPKDDLRKDARLQDFFMMINKKLQGNAESRRRKLHIRTYGVATLNETSGFIQWVVNTMPIRPILLKLYKTRGLNGWDNAIQKIFMTCKEAEDKVAVHTYLTKVLPAFPPVFRDWFLETFPEPSAWLAARMAYGRTLAVMSMVGFVLGLGDRHSENLMMCTVSGDVVHVDFNCIFEKGKSLEQPETVPFRLTQNLVDGLGVTGPEGVFRTACEISMQILRDNKDSLMSVLDAFIHDPLVEWQKEKERINNAPHRRNQVKPSVDLRALAVQANSGIGKKLGGIYKVGVRPEKQFTTSNLVQATIQEAMDHTNLAKMYVGWAPFH